MFRNICKAVVLIGVALVSHDLFSQIIPSSRTIEWSRNTCGVPGGIPNRTTIFTTLNPGATTAQINSAIANCPSNQVVKLNAGTYNVGTINLGTRNGVTLRGAGPGQTILNSSASSACIMSDQYGFATGVNISSGYTKGSTNIVLSSGSGFTVGNLMVMTQNDDTSFVMTSGSPGRRMEYMARITAINGNAVTFWPPLPWGLSSSLAPQAARLNGGPGLSMTGIEDMRINNLGTAADIIQFVGTYACWVKNVELTGGQNTFVFMVSSLQNEMRHCYVHTAAGYPNNSDGFGVYVYGNSTYCLIEDNIFNQVGEGILQTASSANAFLFNYCKDMTFNGWPYQTGGFNCNHGAHPMMCLWEGNISEQFQCDGYHGSSSHQTLFRNWFHGLSNLGVTGNRKMISAERGSYYFNVVGNVLGDASWSGPGTFQYDMNTQLGYTETAVIYRLGYPNVANNGADAGDVAVPWPLIPNSSYPDAKVKSTMLRHGNYDWKNRAIVWDATNSDHSIPASLFYTSKPAYFGNRPWPAFDPASPSSASVTNIPAGFRYVFGVDPPTGPVNNPPTAVASATPTLGLPPLVVAFSSVGSSDPEGVALSYSWNFGDGSALSTAANPSHTYATAGSYFARLTVSDGTNTTSSADINIRVGNQPPAAGASATPNIGSPPLTVAFSSAGSSDPEGTALTYSWNFGDGSGLSTAANPSHSYQTVGTYTARLTVSDGVNAATSSNLIISVSTSLVAAYGFEDGSGTTAVDASGNGNAGTINGATWAASGRYGKALSFNGTTALLTVNDSATLDLTTGMTFEAWLNPTAISGDYQSIISKPIDSAFTQISYVLHGGSRPGGQPSITVSASPSNLTGPATLPLNTWSHLAGTYDGTTMRLYVNGVQVASQPQSGAVVTSTESVRIGMEWAGLIDELRIYNRALTLGEIQADMATPIGAAVKPAAPSNLRIAGQ